MCCCIVTSNEMQNQLDVVTVGDRQLWKGMRIPNFMVVHGNGKNVSRGWLEQQEEVNQLAAARRLGAKSKKGVVLQGDDCQQRKWWVFQSCAWWQQWCATSKCREGCRGFIGNNERCRCISNTIFKSCMFESHITPLLVILQSLSISMTRLLSLSLNHTRLQPLQNTIVILYRVWNTYFTRLYSIIEWIAVR